LGYDPCSLAYYCEGEYLVVGGSDRKVTLYTKDGVSLKVVAERDDWVWSIKTRPKSKYIVRSFRVAVMHCLPYTHTHSHTHHS
jgi:intraflagellar transport protein 122